MTQAVDTTTQLQALNKERLQLPIELQALKTQAYAPLLRFERYLQWLMVATIPLLLCLIAWVLFLYQRRRRTSTLAAYHQSLSDG